jgi:phosphopantothenoylcysteine decarboxylase/phosphopantothenate--cysteine ligase
MDVDMLNHPATRQNLQKLSSIGNILIESVTGELASGLEGKGRMEEPDVIIKTLADYFKKTAGEKKNDINKLAGLEVLVTAGPTYEPIDPVRFVGNYSTGKMGFAIAEALVNCGAKVRLISGPVQIKPPDLLREYIPVQTSDEMYTECRKRFSSCDIAILSAAVADYKSENKTLHKIKSTSAGLTLALTKTTDIAGELGKIKKHRQILVGFALETENALQNATEKLKKKNFDLIVMNSLEDEQSGFGFDTNKITIIDKDNKITGFGLKKKSEAALDIINYISEKFL